MLTPSGNWQWYWDIQTESLAVELDDGLCMVTAISDKLLSRRVEASIAFNLDDTDTFYATLEALEIYCPNLSSAQCVQICLNACAAKQFHKPVGMKSWFFDEQGDCQAVTAISTIQAQEQGHVLVLETGSNSTTCMLIDKEIKLNEQKTLDQFTVIKVATNRLMSVETSVWQQKYA